VSKHQRAFAQKKGSSKRAAGACRQYSYGEGLQLCQQASLALNRLPTQLNSSPVRICPPGKLSDHLLKRLHTFVTGVFIAEGFCTPPGCLGKESKDWKPIQ